MRHLTLTVLILLILTGCVNTEDSNPVGEEGKESSLSPSTGDAQRTEPAIETKPKLPFKEYVELPLNHDVQELEILSDHELRVRLNDTSTDRSYYSLINRETKEITELITDDLGEDVGSYDVISPTGEWIARVDRTIPGIWGKSASTAELTQWTNGEGDWSPQWSSDGLSFYYLHATGKRLGDGAGPEHTLAKYDILSGKKTILSYERGFWGRIAWLDVDRSLVAYNGFDDMIGLKVVNLQEGMEKQLLSTTDLAYTSVAINPAQQQILVSEHGSFTWYDSKGKVVNRQPWPDGLDPSTKKNASYVEGGNPYEFPYYEMAVGGGQMGPYDLQFSPDGRQLAYLLGAIGSSIHDRVTGAKLVISQENGREPAYAEQEYAQVQAYAWSPSSNHLFVVFGEEGRSYIAVAQSAAAAKD